MKLPYPSLEQIGTTVGFCVVAAVCVAVCVAITVVSMPNGQGRPPVDEIDYVSTQAYADAACEFMAMKALSFHPRDPKITIQANYEAVVYCYEPETNLTARSLIPLIKK